MGKLIKARVLQFIHCWIHWHRPVDCTMEWNLGKPGGWKVVSIGCECGKTWID